MAKGKRWRTRLQIFPNLNQSPFEAIKANGEVWIRRTFGYGIQVNESFHRAPINLDERPEAKRLYNRRKGFKVSKIWSDKEILTLLSSR